MKIIADENIPFVSECFSSLGEVKVLNGRDITAETVKDADILLVRSITKVDANLLKKSKVAFVGTATIGYEHIDVDYLVKNKIGFASAPGSNANSVAEYVIAALLEIGGKYDLVLEGKSIGIIGAGNVGSKVAEKCKALEMKVLLNDPPLQRQTSDKKYLPLERLFDCDIITLHTPLTYEGIDKTFHLSDEKFFRSLKKDCVFINTARGGVVDTNALKNAIKKGIVKSAVLDVWENEPNVDVGLLEMVDIGTPHIAGYSLDGKVTGLIMIYQAACKYFKLPVKRRLADFLPPADVVKIEIENNGVDKDEILRQTVKKIYDIAGDDADLRRILDMSKNKSGFIFDRQRKSYHIRREFYNTTVTVTRSEGSLFKKLKGIGFKVSEGKKS
jgi:erythronate-4-phosphate dehydrogenase